MNTTMNLLMRAAIAAAATDREKFVDKVSELIENKVGTSPESAEKIAGGLDTLVEMLDQQLFLDQLTGKTTDTSTLERKLDRLTDAIERLNRNLETMGEK